MALWKLRTGHRVHNALIIRAAGERGPWAVAWGLQAKEPSGNALPEAVARGFRAERSRWETRPLSSCLEFPGRKKPPGNAVPEQQAAVFGR